MPKVKPGPCIQDVAPGRSDAVECRRLFAGTPVHPQVLAHTPCVWAVIIRAVRTISRKGQLEEADPPTPMGVRCATRAKASSNWNPQRPYAVHLVGSEMKIWS